MGGEVLLLMEKGETRKVRLFLENICEKANDVLWLEAPKIKGYGPYGPAGCWIDFKRNVIRVGYQMREFSVKWADAVGCAIRDHFKVKKGGWDSVGYCDNFMKTRPWEVNIMLTERALKKTPERANCPGIFGEIMKDDIKKYKEYQEIYENATKELFKGVKK